jgi:hypothetical protein
MISATAVSTTHKKNIDSQDMPFGGSLYRVGSGWVVPRCGFSGVSGGVGFGFLLTLPFIVPESRYSPERYFLTFCPT